jgi:hypothetical protein
VIFHARYRRALSRIEAALCQADPGLAAQFERFNRLAATSSETGGRTERRDERRKLLALVLVPLVAIVALWMVVSLGGKHAGGCAIPLGSACMPGRPGCQPAGAAAGNQPGDVPPPATFRLAEVGGVAAGAGRVPPGAKALASASRVSADAGKAPAGAGGAQAGAGRIPASSGQAPADANRVSAGAGGRCPAYPRPLR